MLETIANIKIKIDNWESQWLLPNETPIHICKEFHFQYGRYLAAIEEHAKAMQAEKDKQEADFSNEESILEEAHVD